MNKLEERREWLLQACDLLMEHLEDEEIELWQECTTEGWWETKDKKSIRIKDMTDSHLINALKQLERKHFRPTAQNVLRIEVDRRIGFAKQVIKAEETLANLAEYDTDNLQTEAIVEDVVEEW
jgi:diphthamide biosynthesis methyltransferase